MITYSNSAKESYIKQIEKLQAELSSVPGNIINSTDMHWLIHTALSDLKKVVESEHK